MAARKKSAQINLLPQEQFAASTTGRVLTWALSTFRIIVIATELVVILAFLSRFFLDAQNADLSDEIEQKQATIAAAADFEKTFRATQKRLTVFSELTSEKTQATDSLSKVSQSLPPDVFLDSITLGGGSLIIAGFSPSERSIQEFVVNLESRLIPKAVTLQEIETSFEDPSLMKFTINASEPVVVEEGV
ncbi:MAG: Type IV pilus biogenesis protein PilN [Candidatus Woesebacteria bacterium GW2011_GWA1_45_8]|uniref:Type IV pilus biogenesis protein PilN n=1 Tax=Candidatus Woesebacteria bacterium GW2011_GWA1_45_8 TaxID=1618559 RepID=A0A0G1QUE4_9BACT|nr:MAG: Type IV pilus biogenesis protein PilN [Candidatus Woesebacteria bacterium GW2011_GWA1_45_8]